MTVPKRGSHIYFLEQKAWCCYIKGTKIYVSHHLQQRSVMVDINVLILIVSWKRVFGVNSYLNWREAKYFLNKIWQTCRNMCRKNFENRLTNKYFGCKNIFESAVFNGKIARILSILFGINIICHKILTLVKTSYQNSKLKIMSYLPCPCKIPIQICFGA